MKLPHWSHLNPFPLPFLCSHCFLDIFQPRGGENPVKPANKAMFHLQGCLKKSRFVQHSMVDNDLKTYANVVTLICTMVQIRFMVVWSSHDQTKNLCNGSITHNRGDENGSICIYIYIIYIYYIYILYICIYTYILIYLQLLVLHILHTYWLTTYYL